jgi:16S rRNA (adenine1518-N6/adenine1519-N6)-dimethyltransferase
VRELPGGRPDPTSRSQLRALFRAHDFRPRRSRGQTFLTDANMVRKIVAAAGIGKEDQVLEIGPGAGAMTRALVGAAKRVVAIEVDHTLVTILGETVGELGEVVEGDVLEVDWASLLQGEGAGGWKVVANLPYAITGPALLKLLDARDWIERLTIMVQLEVAERLVAGPGSKTRGLLSVLTQAICDAKMLFRVSPTCFWPAPRVDSAVVLLTVRRPPLIPPALFPSFRRMVHGAFGTRRKTLANALSHATNLGMSKQAAQELATECGLAPERRAESLSVEEFLCLAQRYEARGRAAR